MPLRRFSALLRKRRAPTRRSPFYLPSAPTAPAHRNYSTQERAKYWRQTAVRPVADRIPASTERNARMETKYAPPASPKMCPQPPAFSICRPLRPVTDEPVPAFTAIPSRSRKHAAIPESRSLPATIFAFGQTARASFSNTARSSSVTQPARKTPIAIYFAWQNAKNFRDLIRRRQAQIRRRQFSRLDDCAIGHQRPCGLRSSTLDPENSFVDPFCTVAAVYDRRPKCKRKFVGGHSEARNTGHQSCARDTRCVTLASSHCHPERKRRTSPSPGGHTRYIGTFATLCEVPQSEPDWRCLRGSG